MAALSLGASQLGWTTWLRTQEFTEDARAAIFEPRQVSRSEPQASEDHNMGAATAP